jgi:hypothetical protein
MTIRSTRLRWIRAAPLAVLFIVGCIRDLNVTAVSLTTLLPSFSVSPDHPGIHVINVSNVSTDPANYTILWTVVSERGGSVHEITYGKTPPGFDVQEPPHELFPGVRYRLSVSGSGRYGDIDFEISPTVPSSNVHDT